MFLHTVPFLQQDNFNCSRIRGSALVQIQVRHHHVNYHGVPRVERIEKVMLSCRSSIMCGVTRGDGTNDWTKCVHPNRPAPIVLPAPTASPRAWSRTK